MKKKILMVGPKIDMKGGISAVSSTLLNSGLSDDTDIHYLNSYIDGTKVQKLMVFLKSIVVFIFQLIIKRIDIVHIHTASRASFRRKTIMYFLAKLFRKKVIMHVHGAEFMIYYNNANNFEKKIITHVLENSDTTIALSEKWKDQLQRIAPKAKIEIVYNPVNIKGFQRIAQNELEENINILFMGRVGERKGVYDLLEIVPSVIKKYTNVKFMLCGDGELEKVREYIQQNKLEHFVELPGWTSGIEKINYYQKAAIYVLPSYNEGLPISILEAMASSLPIVATDVGGIPEAVEHNENGYLIVPGDKKRLKEYLLELIKSKELRQQYGKYGLKKCEKLFDINVIVGKIHDIYSNVMDGKTK
ncbi:glycosyltransferase family 4 protein [Bacillus mobilis]|uniref:glycosyltransferase family 4 protein n=1 Tax=Bacillus mobilis TaxID=2026190 RepID=UPI0035DCF112